MTLQKAQIKPEPNGGDPVDVMFNPDQITYTKQANWNFQHANGQTLPGGAFTGGVPPTLQVTLIFDGTEDGRDVAKIVDKLSAMTRVNSDLSNGTVSSGGAHPHQVSPSQQHRPPTVQFTWGTFLSFKAAITKMISRFTLFLDDGTPVRASVDVTFTQIVDQEFFPPQNPTSGGRTGERIHRLAPRETLDQVAYAAFGQTGLWRALAAFNGIDDPLRLQAGDPILLPASVDDLKSLA
jgi:hypothetical protein